jgi:hypothetical protein
VFVGDQRAHVGDLGALGQPVDHERVQAVGVRHRNVQQEVVAARHHEHADDLEQRSRPVAEGLDALARRRPDRHRDQRLHVAAQRLERNVGVIAADDAGGAQAAHALRRRRGRDVHGSGEVAVRRRRRSCARCATRRPETASV